MEVTTAKACRSETAKVEEALSQHGCHSSSGPFSASSKERFNAKAP